jgi:hypothetical protein
MKNKTIKIMGIGAVSIFLFVTLIPACIAISANSGNNPGSLNQNACPAQRGPGLGPDVYIIDYEDEYITQFHIATTDELWEMFYSYWEQHGIPRDQIFYYIYF